MISNNDIEKIRKAVAEDTKKIVKEETVKIVKEETVKIVKQELKPIKKYLKVIVRFFDHEYLALNKRVERIEEHLHLPRIV